MTINAWSMYVISCICNIVHEISVFIGACIVPIIQMQDMRVWAMLLFGISQIAIMLSCVVVPSIASFLIIIHRNLYA
jgi:hypothetical protein